MGYCARVPICPFYVCVLGAVSVGGEEGQTRVLQATAGGHGDKLLCRNASSWHHHRSVA